MASTPCFVHNHALTATATRSSLQRQVSNIKPTQLVVCRARKQAAVVQEEDNSTVVSRRLALTVLVGAAAIGSKVVPADTAYAATEAEQQVGQWTPIKNLKDPYVQEIAKFAVDEHNKESKEDLTLENVVKGYTQVVEGTNYRLILALKLKEGVSNNFEAVVWDKPWERFRKLTEFVPLLA